MAGSTPSLSDRKRGFVSPPLKAVTAWRCGRRRYEPARRGTAAAAAAPEPEAPPPAATRGADELREVAGSLHAVRHEDAVAPLAEPPLPPRIPKPPRHRHRAPMRPRPGHAGEGGPIAAF